MSVTWSMKRRFACVYAVTIETVRARQAAFQRLVFARDVRVRTEVVAKRDRPQPLRRAYRNQVKVMRSHGRRRLAEPVLELDLVGCVTVAQLDGGGDGRT